MHSHLKWTLFFMQFSLQKTMEKRISYTQSLCMGIYKTKGRFSGGLVPQ